MDYVERYVEFLQTKASSFEEDAGVRFAIDCSSGMSSLLVRRIFPSAIVINDEMDGNFAVHSPNPLLAEAREMLADKVRTEGLDFGFIFDGDGDRVMVVDEAGRFIQPDYLIPVIARTMSKATGIKSRVVLHDVRTSRGTTETLQEEGFEPVMVPVGHAFAKPKMRELDALCGGELAGHYYFGDFFGCDSGMLAALRIFAGYRQWREAHPGDGGNGTFSAMMRPIMTRYVNSGELNYRVMDKDRAIERALSAAESEIGAFSQARVSCIDGVRVDYEDMWFNIRKSNTEPYLRLIVEARTLDRLEDCRKTLEKAITV